MSANRIRRPLLIAIPIAAVALVGAGVAFAGAAHAGTMPTTGPTIAMTITNNTDNTLYLQGSDNPYGDWIAAPQAVLAPHATEIVTASSWNPGGFAIDAAYGTAGDATAVFMANNYPGNATTDGTRVDGANTNRLGIQTSVDTGSPTMNASYTIMPPLW
jgi:hypothetical protein